MKNNIKFISLTLALLLAGFTAGAQTVKGRVTDEQKTPIIGATVIVDGTSTGTTTNATGDFTITLPAGKDVLRVSFVGYLTETVNVGKQTNLSITLKDSATEVEEVQVVGYGVVRKSDITGSLTSVKIDEGDAARSTSLDRLLQGKAAGVQVTSTSFAPGAAVDIKVRGTSSLNTSGEPLYVVDGVILNPPSQSEGTLLNQGTSNTSSDTKTNGLMGINPSDIASMEILKDASATAIYGQFGANGVVLITTKTGQKERPTITLTTGVDISHRYKRLPLMNLTEYIGYLDQVHNETELAKIFADPTDRSLGFKDGIQEVDWQDYTMRTAVNQRYRLSLSGKTKSLNYMMAAGYLKSQGIIRNSGASQYDARLNLDKTVSKYLKVGTRISFAQIELDMTQGTDAGQTNSNSSLMRSMINSRPWYNFKYEEGLAANPEAADSDEDAPARASVPAWLSDFNDHSVEYRLIPSVYAQITPWKWLTYKISVNGDYRNKERMKWKGPLVNFEPTYKGIAAVSDLRTLRYNIDNTLNALKTIGRHHINVMVGNAISSSNYRTQTPSAWQVDQYVPQEDNMNTGQVGQFGYSETKSSTVSYFARGVYSYNNRYILTATYRIDGSSKFYGSNKYAHFPSLAFAWRADQEKWLHLPEAVSSLKFRMGWGRVGNEGLPAYRTLANYGSTTYPAHNISEFVRGVNPTNMANSSLKWETSEQYNAGVDLGLFGGRLSATVDVYDKHTKDLLQDVDIPALTGFAKMWVNMGEIQNKGIEITLDATPVNTRNFTWNLGGNLSMNRNKIIDLGLPPKDDGRVYKEGSLVGSSNYLKDYVNIFINGRPMGLFYGYRTDGLIQQGDKAGSINYVYAEGNTSGTLSFADKVILGDPNPRMTYGFNTSFTYKGLSLSVAFNGVYDIDVVNANLLMENDISRDNTNKRRDAVTKAWTPENTNTTYPRLPTFVWNETTSKWDKTGTYYGSTETLNFTDRLVEDASYLRLSNITLAYNVRFKNQHQKFVRSMDLSFSVGNVWVWTDYTGWDPEVKSYGSDVFRMGVDNGSYPNARTYSVGLNLNF